MKILLALVAFAIPAVSIAAPNFETITRAQIDQFIAEKARVKYRTETYDGTEVVLAAGACTASKNELTKTTTSQLAVAKCVPQYSVTIVNVDPKGAFKFAKDYILEDSTTEAGIQKRVDSQETYSHTNYGEDSALQDIVDMSNAQTQCANTQSIVNAPRNYTNEEKAVIASCLGL